jgi:hypothetical protein
VVDDVMYAAREQEDMTYILALGIFAFFATRILGSRRTITPQIAREAEPERPMTATIWREPAETDRANQAAIAPIEAGMPTIPSDYLLGGQRADGAPDTMAAMMDMMSGPGLCTPPAP